MNRLKAWLLIIRPPIVLISCLGAYVGAFNASAYLGIDIGLERAFMLILGAFCLAAGLMVHNDVTDLESDTVNRPHKALPSGAIKARTAYIVGLGLMIASIVIAASRFNVTAGILTFFIVLIGIYYNHYGKYTGIWGHVMVAFGVGAIPYWGSVFAFPDEIWVMLPLALAIGVQEVGREIMVCVGDLKGDKEAGFKTTPVRLGRKRAMYLSLLFYLGFIPIYPAPYYGWFGADKVFGSLYIWGGTMFVLGLIGCWLATYMVVLKGDEKAIWNAFERYERTGTRLFVLFFQVVLLLEVFY